MYTYMDRYMCICICICICMYMSVSMAMSMYMYMHMYTCACGCVEMYVEMYRPTAEGNARTTARAVKQQAVVFVMSRGLLLSHRVR